MKQFIKRCFEGDKNPMKTILMYSIGASLTLHVLEAPEWCYLVLVICTILIHIIVTSD